MNTNKKITKATIKSFVNKNRGKLYIRIDSRFNGMSDMVEQLEGGFEPAVPTDRWLNETFGIKGLQCFGGSGRAGDLYKVYEDARFVGYNIYNCCGEQTIVVRK